MVRKNRVKIQFLFVVMVVTQLLVACDGSTITEPGGLSRQQAEHELVSFLLDYIVHQQIPGDMPYIPPQEGSDNGAVSMVSIIILAAPGENPNSSRNPLDLSQPQRVWLYIDNQLYEALDVTTTIEQYRQDHMDYPNSQSWGFYDFGIISIREDGLQAKVFWEVSCGANCGRGYMHTLERNASGKWEITGTEWMWIA